VVTYGEKDIYGESKRRGWKRFPKAIFVEIENAGHIAWRHNKGKFVNTLNDFYRIQ
jgi:proline iminopeptidase